MRNIDELHHGDTKMVKPINVASDFDYLVTFLPAGWQSKAKELGALKRCRKIPNAETLLRVLLLHLAEGCSLRETSTRLARGGIANVSDVAIMDRLRSAGAWFRWMSLELMRTWVDKQPDTVFGTRTRIRLVDGTRVKEPGPTGSSWCIHYSVELPTLACCNVTIQDKHGNGETFKKFEILPKDLMIGDRAYGTPPSIGHVIDNGGNVLVRFAWNLLPLWLDENKRFDLLDHLRTLRGTQAGDWNVIIKNGSQRYEGRVCAIKKSRQATDVARKKIRRASQKHGIETQTETFETAGYVMVFTSVPREDMGPTAALNMYRGRWQIELVFKRLKSLLEFGHLKKTDHVSIEAWLHGKLLVAFLIEALLREGEAFSPWGYVVPQAREPEQVSLA